LRLIIILSVHKYTTKISLSKLNSKYFEFNSLAVRWLYDFIWLL